MYNIHILIVDCNRTVNILCIVSTFPKQLILSSWIINLRFAGHKDNIYTFTCYNRVATNDYKPSPKALLSHIVSMVDYYCYYVIFFKVIYCTDIILI